MGTRSLVSQSGLLVPAQGMSPAAPCRHSVFSTDPRCFQYVGARITANGSPAPDRWSPLSMLAVTGLRATIRVFARSFVVSILCAQCRAGWPGRPVAAGRISRHIVCVRSTALDAKARPHRASPGQRPVAAKRWTGPSAETSLHPLRSGITSVASIWKTSTRLGGRRTGRRLTPAAALTGLPERAATPNRSPARWS